MQVKRKTQSEISWIQIYDLVLGWPKSTFVFQAEIKDTFFIFTKNFIEHIHRFVLLPSAIFQATS